MITFKQWCLLFFLGNFLLKQRHPIVMLSCLYLKNLVHLCYYYQYLELPVVWIPQAKNSLFLSVEGSESSTTNCQKSFLNVIVRHERFLGHHTSPVTFMFWWRLSYLSCCCWNSCSMMFVLVLYSWICYPFIWLTSIMPGNILCISFNPFSASTTSTL